MSSRIPILVCIVLPFLNDGSEYLPMQCHLPENLPPMELF